MTNRREFIKTFITGGAATLLVAPHILTGQAFARESAHRLWPGYAADDAWASDVPKILERIKSSS